MELLFKIFEISKENSLPLIFGAVASSTATFFVLNELHSRELKVVHAEANFKIEQIESKIQTLKQKRNPGHPSIENLSIRVIQKYGWVSRK